MTKLRRGPVLCDAGNGEHQALNPQVVTSGWMHGRVMCANCCGQAAWDAMRTRDKAHPHGLAFSFEPLELVLEQARVNRRGRVRGSHPLAAVVDMDERRKA